MRARGSLAPLRELWTVWPALGALGTALVHASVATITTPAASVCLLIAAAVEAVWAMLALRAGRPVVLRTAFGYFCLAPLVWLLLGVATPTAGAVPALPFLSASVLSFSVAACCGRMLRTGGAQASTANPLPALLVGAVLLAAITTPALASIGAGGARPVAPVETPEHDH